jgi:hypothetical protein
MRADYGVIVKTSIRFTLMISAAASFFLGVAVASADQVTLQNGDTLNGKVLALTANSLTLQDDSLGTLILSRARVSNITFGAMAISNPAPRVGVPPAVQATPTANPQANSVYDSSLKAIGREIQEHSNLVQEVEAQVLGSSADPAAMNKFNELVGQLSSGQMDMNGLRSEAQNAANELQDYKKQLGPDADQEFNGYLSILNTFLQETAPTNAP